MSEGAMRERETKDGQEDQRCLCRPAASPPTAARVTTLHHRLVKPDHRVVNQAHTTTTGGGGEACCTRGAHTCGTEIKIGENTGRSSSNETGGDRTSTRILMRGNEAMGNGTARTNGDGL
jgi:hypothetical protein